MDKTLKIHAYSDTAKSDGAKEKSAKELDIALELEKKTAHLEEERSKTLDLLKTIVQLRESLKQEQAKTAVLEARLNKLDSVEENQLVKKNAQLEDEKKHSLEYMRTIQQLRESLQQEQEKSARMAAGMAELETKANKLDTEEENPLDSKDERPEEEKNKLLEYEKTIEQLRENQKQELEKSAQMVNRIAELESKVNKMDAVEENQLVRKNTLLEEEKKKSGEYAKLVDQLRQSIKGDQEQSFDMIQRTAELEARVKDLSGLLGKISTMIAEKKLDSDT